MMWLIVKKERRDSEKVWYSDNWYLKEIGRYENRNWWNKLAKNSIRCPWKNSIRCRRLGVRFWGWTRSRSVRVYDRLHGRPKKGQRHVKVLFIHLTLIIIGSMNSRCFYKKNDTKLAIIINKYTPSCAIWANVHKVVKGRSRVRYLRDIWTITKSVILKYRPFSSKGVGK